MKEDAQEVLCLVRKCDSRRDESCPRGGKYRREPFNEAGKFFVLETETGQTWDSSLESQSQWEQCRASGWTQGLSAQPTLLSPGHHPTICHHLPCQKSRSILTSTINSPHVQELGTRELECPGSCFFTMSSLQEAKSINGPHTVVSFFPV